MPRLDVSIGTHGPIVQVGLAITREDAQDLAAIGRSVLNPFSVSGLLDTGAEMTAIEQSLAAWMGIPINRFLEARSSVLGDESRQVGVYRVQMTFGPIEAPDPPRWRTLDVVGVNVVSPGATILIGRDLLASCRSTYDGRKQRLMLSY